MSQLPSCNDFFFILSLALLRLLLQQNQTNDSEDSDLPCKVDPRHWVVEAEGQLEGPMPGVVV